MPSLDVFLHDRFVGVVEPDSRDRRRVTLAIDAGYLSDRVVLSEAFAALPGRRPSIRAVSNFLGGYVPEGNHRERMAAKRRVDPNDLFALLSEFGGSIAGAVSMRRPDETAMDASTYEPLTDKSLEARLKQAVDDSDQGIPDDSRSTLPGYQPKVLVAQGEGGWVYPHGRAHSTYILKPQVPVRPTRIFDEFYSHQLARAVGLSTFGSELHTLGRTVYLAIERFDREVTADGVTLIHQEDLAQALELDWRDSDMKFQSDEWPTDPKRASARRIGELLGSIPGGDAAVERWLRQLTFHAAIGNNDAHAKNVALLHLAEGTELTQVYDALPNLFQPGLVSHNLALAVDGVFDHRRVSAEHILAEAKSWGVISDQRAALAVTEVLTSFGEAVSSTEPPVGSSRGMADRLRWNAARLLAGSEISEPKR